MQLYTSRMSSLEDVPKPSALYKYREAGKSFHRTILTQREVFFAAPYSFEDELDCKIPTRYDLLTDEDIYNYYFENLTARHPELSESQIIHLTDEWVREGNMRNKVHLEKVEKDYFDNLNKRFGVLCLTAEPCNKNMWEKYSANLNGFCVGFDPTILFLFLGGGGDVIYYDELPIIMPFIGYEEHHNILVYSKLKHWDFEKEYRTHKTWGFDVTDNHRKIVLPKEVYKEVIIGEYVEQGAKKEIIEAARAINPEILILMSSLVNDDIKIEPNI